MVTTKDFLTAIGQIAGERPRYRLGGSARDGTCDCIGFIIGALDRSGFAWPGTHGSNWAARNALTSSPKPIVSAKQLRPGDLVFKSKDPFDPGYALPERYKAHPDPRDYYHVGVVTGVNPISITHCTTPTVRTDTQIAKWDFYGRLKYLSQASEGAQISEGAQVSEGVQGATGKPPEGDESQSMKTMIVTCTPGETVRLRKNPSTTAGYWVKLPNGTEVQAEQSAMPGWHYVQYGKSTTGYMISEFLTEKNDPVPADPDPDETFTLTFTSIQFDKLLAACDTIRNVISSAELERSKE